MEAPQSQRSESQSKVFTLLLSVAAIAVAYYAAQQTSRAAKANEEMTLISQKQTTIAKEQSDIVHEQTRPRLVFSDVQVAFNADYIIVHASVLNMGNAPALLKKAELIVEESPCAVTTPFPQTSNAIIYPGWSRKSSIWSRRKRRVAQEQSRHDCAAVDPSRFIFAADYELYQHSELAFHESLHIPSLRWATSRSQAASFR